MKKGPDGPYLILPKVLAACPQIDSNLEYAMSGLSNHIIETDPE
ncbi:hypothetical protein [Serratia phage SP1]|nr:hypothetical protein [Serratia phage SP1]